MPTVGNKKFSYTTAGQDAARKYAKETKQSIVYSYDEGGLYKSPYESVPMLAGSMMSPEKDRTPGYMQVGSGSMMNQDYIDKYGATRKRPTTEEDTTAFSKENYMNQLKTMEEGGKAEGPKYPHDMYNTATGEKFVAENKEDHDRMDKLGYKHLDELSDDEKKMVMEKKNEMAMGGKYEQFKRLMGLD